MLLFLHSLAEEARTKAFEEKSATIKAHHVKAVSKVWGFPATLGAEHRVHINGLKGLSLLHQHWSEIAWTGESKFPLMWWVFRSVHNNVDEAIELLPLKNILYRERGKCLWLLYWRQRFCGSELALQTLRHIQLFKLLKWRVRYLPTCACLAT